MRRHRIARRSLAFRGGRRCPGHGPSALRERALPKRPKRGPGIPLALGELEARARLAVAVLLALDHARIAGEEAPLLEEWAQVRFEIGQRLGETMTHRAC